MKPFDILSRELFCDNPWIPIEKQVVRLPNGEVTEWFLALGHRVVIVVPLLTNGEILLQRAYKHGAGEAVFEFCAGMVEDDEDILVAAARELAEETGYAAEEILPIGKIFANPTGSGTQYFIVLAKNCKKKHAPTPEASEQIENFSVADFDAATKALIENPSSAGALSALLLAREYLNKRQ